MIATLMIENLALIDQLELEFAPGLNIMTGETGAGKSIVLGAIQLLLGQRADRGKIRRGAPNCTVGAVFELATKPELMAEIHALTEPVGVPVCEDGQLLLRRVISEKSSRNYINGCPVNLATLSALGELLVDMHGPYDHQSLLDIRRQLQLLDTYAGADSLLTHCQLAYRAWQQAQQALEDWERNAPNPAQLENMAFQLKEIQAVNLDPEEVEDLTRQHAVAMNSSQLMEILDHCRRAVAEDDQSALNQLGGLVRQLHQLAEIDEQRGPQLLELLDAAIAHTAALSDEVGSLAQELDVNPFALADIEKQLSAVSALQRKYGPTIERVREYAAQLEQDLANYADAESARAELVEAVASAEVALLASAKKLTAKRTKAAPKLAKAITKKLTMLGFKDCQFHIALSSAEPSASGVDRVEFQFAPNVGEGRHNLREIASSGEIARVMLAVKTVLAAADRVPVLVFDEIDANVGGPTATVVGREMAALGNERQILCITHLPQVAAGASRHFQIHKQVADDRTRAAVSQLDADTRIDELARMLGGKDSSSVVEKHARELINQAKAAS